MSYTDRCLLIEEIEKLRPNRKLMVFFNFDRKSIPNIPGIAGSFHSDVKEPLYRVLKESISDEREKVDLCIYTRGGDTNSVWPIVSLIREFDPEFHVLVPFRCHSAGTLLALAASKIILAPLSELSPIDPSTGNQFNPRDRIDESKRLAISVEDVTAYREFVREHFNDSFGSLCAKDQATLLLPSLEKLISEVHPIALGNVQRAYNQIRLLAEKLLKISGFEGETEQIIDSLTKDLCSHLHMINRHEAKKILGEDKVEFADAELSEKLNELIYGYEKEYSLRNKLFIKSYMGQERTKEQSFAAALIESNKWSYEYNTKLRMTQSSKIPKNVQLQLPAGQELPLIDGLPRNVNVDVLSQGWERKYPQE